MVIVHSAMPSMANLPAGKLQLKNSHSPCKAKASLRFYFPFGLVNLQAAGKHPACKASSNTRQTDAKIRIPIAGNDS